MDSIVEEILVSDCKKYINCFRTEIGADGREKYVCKSNGCDKEYSDKSGAIRHLKKHHVETYNAVKHNKNSDPREDSTSKPEIEIRVKVRTDDILDACVDLVTVNALPLSIVESSAFRRILKPYVTALKLKGINLVINRENIKDSIERRAQKIKKSIRLETKHKLLSLMLDIASRYNRSILGINIGFMKDGKICIRSSGMIVLNFSHTAAYIAELIKKNLAEYEIGLNQIISITTDNGKNMVKSIALLDSTYQQMKLTDPCENEIQSDEYIDDGIFDEEYYSDLLGRVREMFDTPEYTDLIHGVSCGIHCLHLVVTKAIKSSAVTKNLVNRSRELVKILRTPTFRSKLTAAKLKMAKIDVETRWNSIFVMVSIATAIIILE